MFEMMKMMCPKCLSVATLNASIEDKNKLKAQISEAFNEI